MVMSQPRLCVVQLRDAGRAQPLGVHKENLNGRVRRVADELGMLRREGGRVAPASRRWCGGWSTPCGCPCCCRRRSLARGGASATMAAVWPKNGPSWHPGQRRAQGGGPSADAFRLLSNSAFQPPSWRPTAEIMEMCSSPATRASWCKPFRSSIRERWSGLGLARRNTSHRAAGSRDSRDSRQIAASSGAARRPISPEQRRAWHRAHWRKMSLCASAGNVAARTKNRRSHALHCNN